MQASASNNWADRHILHIQTRNGRSALGKIDGERLNVIKCKTPLENDSTVSIRKIHNQRIISMRTLDEINVSSVSS